MKNKILGKLERFLLKKGKSYLFCPVCGKFTKIRIYSDNFREDGLCKKCESNSRKRHLAKVLLRSIVKTSHKGRFSCLAKIPVNLGLKIYNVESNGALHEKLKHINEYVCSEYFGDIAIVGKEKNGILNVDLQDIPFEENTFDFVITTEVFEHIPDPYKAFSELHRILKKGGKHIFTVPFYDKAEKDEVRAIINEQGEPIYLLPAEYHGDPIRGEGILVYTIFAKEMFGKLETLGFNVQVDHMRNPIFGVLGGNNIVFIITKK